MKNYRFIFVSPIVPCECLHGEVGGCIGLAAVRIPVCGHSCDSIVPCISMHVEIEKLKVDEDIEVSKSKRRCYRLYA